MFPLRSQTSRVIFCLICAACVFEFYTAFLSSPYFRVEDSSRRFAVFSCATPEKLNTRRGFDYAFYLPLTVLAWQRIGFESIIVIIGERSEWQSHPVLSHVLDTLERLPVATVLFMAGKIENRMMLSQVLVRICVANMKRFPGRSSDFVMTTDSDICGHCGNIISTFRKELIDRSFFCIVIFSVFLISLAGPTKCYTL
jgi:hypothetical protein